MATQGDVAAKTSGRWVVVIAALAFAVRTIGALRRPFHTDERFSLSWASFSPKDMLTMLRYTDVHPPLYFMLLHFLGLAHAPDWIPRMLMVVLGTISVVLLYWVVRIWTDERAAIVAGVSAAFMPVLVFYDTWVRMYALSNALVLTQFYVLSLLLTRDGYMFLQRRWLWLGWVLAVVAAGYTLYIAWFAVAAQLLYVAFMQRKRLIEFGTALLVAFVLWMPQVPALLQQMGKGGLTFQGFAGHQLAGLFSIPAQATLVPQLEGWPSGVAVVVTWVWLGVGLWAVLTYARNSLLPWLGAPALLIFLYGLVTHKLIYLDRYYMSLGYALAAWTGCLVALAMQRGWRSVAVATVVFVAAFSALGIAYAVLPGFYTADWPAVASALSRQEQPGDLVLMEQGMPFWTLANDKDIIDHPHMYIFYPNQIPKALDAARGHKRVWVMAYEPRGIDRDLVLLHSLGKVYRLASVQQFNRYLPAEDVVVLLFVR